MHLVSYSQRIILCAQAEKHKKSTCPLLFHLFNTLSQTKPLVLLSNVFNGNKSFKGLSREIDFKNFDQTLKNLTYLRDAAGV
jgi:hypothetical protein